MNSGFIVELSGEAVGVLVGAGSAYEFHAVDERFRSLEGASFTDGFAAERAARRLVRRGAGVPVRRGRRLYSLTADAFGPGDRRSDTGEGRHLVGVAGAA